MDPVIHFEMPTGDADATIAFYTSVFDWKAQKLGNDMGGYVIVETATTENGRPTKPGTINGGFFAKTDDPASASTGVVIAVDDVDAKLEQIKAAGGTVGEPMEIPGVGRYASFFDPEGNRVGLLAPLMD